VSRLARRETLVQGDTEDKAMQEPADGFKRKVVRMEKVEAYLAY